MAATKDTEHYKKRIAAIFTGLERDIPFARLQQLDRVGIHKVTILVSEKELIQANSKKFMLFDGDTPQTIIDYYHGYLPKNKAHISFEIMNTGKCESEEEKIKYFIKTTQSDNLLNLCFCKDKKLPWLGDQLYSDPMVLDSTITSYQIFNFELFKKVSYQLPSVDQRLSPESADELLQLEKNPILCYPQDDFDIVNYQALFRCFSEAMAISLENMDDSVADLMKDKCNYLIGQYAQAIDRARKTDAQFEQSHQNMYTSKEEPGEITKEQHYIIVESCNNAQKAFPELIRKMISVYRDIHQLRSQQTMSVQQGK